jgi:hypothetical protein
MGFSLLIFVMVYRLSPSNADKIRIENEQAVNTPGAKSASHMRGAVYIIQRVFQVAESM